MRVLSALVLLHFLLVTLAPGWFVADFLLEHDGIAKELCVQRMVPEARRTCHGECQLMKRLKEADQHERNLPDQLRALRTGDLFAQAEEVSTTILPRAAPVQWPDRKAVPLKGHVGRIAPVPWC